MARPRPQARFLPYAIRKLLQRFIAATEPSRAFCIYAPNQQWESIMMRGGLLWLLGIPIPALIILWLLGYL